MKPNTEPGSISPDTFLQAMQIKNNDIKYNG